MREVVDFRQVVPQNQRGSKGAPAANLRILLVVVEIGPYAKCGESLPEVRADCRTPHKASAFIPHVADGHHVKVIPAARFDIGFAPALFEADPGPAAPGTPDLVSGAPGVTVDF